MICVLFVFQEIGFSQASRPAQPITELSMTSDTGDYIGAGQNYYYAPGVGTYFPTASDQTGDGVVDFVQFGFNNLVDNWTIQFATRLTGRNMASGFYDNAMRYPFESGNRPGLTISGNGRGCNQSVGNFTVHVAEFNYTSTPIQITRFAATFEQHCEGNVPAFYGTIYYNYTPSGPTYSISGQVVNNLGQPVGSTPVALNGSHTRSVSTNALGQFSFGQLLSSGTYRVTPLTSVFRVEPSNRLFKIISSNQTADFTLTPFYRIAGQIFNDSGSPLTGVTVRLTGSQTQTVTTDASGRYEFANLLATGNYTVTPTRNFYTFTPASRSYETLPDNQSANFIGTVSRYSIGGRVIDSLGAGIGGIRVDLEGGADGVTTTTNASGNYSFDAVLAGSNYQVRPISSVYLFSPNVQFVNALDRDYTNLVFTGSISARYTINGFVLDTNGNGATGALVTLSGSASNAALTDANGFYSFSALPAGASYTITPTVQGLAFAPANRTTNSLNANVFFNFVGTGVRPRNRFDFDGDGKDDISIWRPETGTWWTILSSTQAVTTYNFGLSGDVIAPEDYDGDGKTDYCVYRAGTWYIQRSRDGLQVLSLGLADDVPVPGDYDGDRKADIAVYRASNATWYILQSRDGLRTKPFGSIGDKPVAADFDGDGKTDLGLFRPATATWLLDQSRAGTANIQFGLSSDLPLAADFDGDGFAEITVFRNGVWWIRFLTGATAQQYGVAGDIPAVGDYDGDRRADLSVYRGGVWYQNRSGQGQRILQFGLQTDIPVSAAYNR